jgi:hypothetical protein
MRLITNGSKVFLFYFLGFAFVGQTRAHAYEGWFGADAGVAYQALGSGLTDSASLSGVSIGGRGVFELRALSLGELSVGLGFGQTWQSGSTTTRSQQMVTRLPILDLGYLHSIYSESLLIGGMIRNSFGAGAHYEISNLNTTQWLTSVGPQVQYRVPSAGDLNVTIGMAILYGFTSSSGAVWQVPLSVGIRLPYTSKQSTKE